MDSKSLTSPLIPYTYKNIYNDDYVVKNLEQLLNVNELLNCRSVAF